MTSLRPPAAITPRIEVKDSDVVFVGYGVVAPEFGWDDFKDVDVRGKTVVMLDQRSAGHERTHRRA